MPRILLGSYDWNMAPLVPEPSVEVFYSGDPAMALDKSNRGLGSLRCRLSWNKIELTGEEYYQLRRLVGRNPSGAVFIRIPTDHVSPVDYQPVWYTYQAELHWPGEGVMQGLYNRWIMPDVELSHLRAYLA